jgi:hypothetical protein
LPQKLRRISEIEKSTVNSSPGLDAYFAFRLFFRGQQHKRARNKRARNERARNKRARLKRSSFRRRVPASSRYYDPNFDYTRFDKYKVAFLSMTAVNYGMHLTSLTKIGRKK